MTVQELKKLLEGVNPEAKVLLMGMETNFYPQLKWVLPFTGKMLKDGSGRFQVLPLYQNTTDYPVIILL